VRLESAAWPVADATPWLPTALPVDGDFTGAIVLDGSLDRLSGRLSGRVEAVAVAGVQSGALQVDLEFDPERLLVHSASWSMPAGEVVGSGTLGFAQGDLAFELSSAGLDTQREPLELSGLTGVSGSVALTAHVAGTLDVPDVRVEVDGSALRVAGQTAPAGGGTRVTAHWAHSELQLQGSLLDLLEFDGGGALSTNGADLRIGFRGDDPQRLLASLGVSLPATLEGAYRGEVTVRQTPEQSGADPCASGTRCPAGRELLCRVGGWLERSVRWGPDRLR
jgi:hypothetical protein